MDTLPTVGKLLAAVVAGFGLATLVPPDPVTVPVAGTVPGLAAGTVTLVAGGALYALVPGSSGCGCAGDCDC